MITMISETHKWEKSKKKLPQFPMNPCLDRYVIAIDGKLRSGSWGIETRYVGINDEGYAAWAYPMSTIHEAKSFGSPEAAIKWWHEVKNEFRRENPGWYFNYETLGLIRIQMSDVIPFE